MRRVFHFGRVVPAQDRLAARHLSHQPEAGESSPSLGGRRAAWRPTTGFSDPHCLAKTHSLPN